MQQLHWGGRREALCCLSLEAEKEVVETAAVGAVQGAVLIAKHLRSLVEQKTRCAVSDDYLHDLLHRHHCKKKAPHPKHPDSHDKVKRRVQKKHRAVIFYF
ncbi:MAG: hypothetical protein ICV51_18380 [Flavisolibacter sp.]|nr:hypothetical protein [Flavisolibacter sp.]